jgi:hypothetical protein
MDAGLEFKYANNDPYVTDFYIDFDVYLRTLSRVTIFPHKRLCGVTINGPIEGPWVSIDGPAGS